MSIAHDFASEAAKRTHECYDKNSPRNYAENRKKEYTGFDKFPEGVTCEKINEPDFKGEHVTKTGNSPKKVIFYIHGGGFNSGSAASRRGFAVTLCDRLGYDVYSADYPLSPEASFPAAPLACYKAYEWLLKKVGPGKIVIMGESAGGALVFSVTLLAREHRISLPIDIVAISPCTQFVSELPSFKKNGETDYIVDHTFYNEIWDTYITKEEDRQNPIASPMLADMHGMPRTLFIACDNERLLDDSVHMEKKMREAGVETEIIIAHNKLHAFPICVEFPEAQDYIGKIVDFIGKDRLHDVLNDVEDNYILPFFWQHGNHTDRLAEQIERIYSTGVKALCVESRTHAEFAGDGWWRDMDIILAECEKRGMKVWLLDDKRFPTGYANGLVDKNPELRGWALTERHVDCIGPLKNAAMIVNPIADEKTEKLIGVYAVRRLSTEEEMTGDPEILTGNISNGFLYLDVPEGCWRVFFIYSNRNLSKPSYISMISKESAHLMIEAIYEPMYEHYKQYFGGTFVGFFSDEPEFGNGFYGKRPEDRGFYETRIGDPAITLPWNEDVRNLMEEELGYDPVTRLPELFYFGDNSPKMRLAYMNAITRLFKECFSYQLGDWCRAHDVQYIGHIIEDKNNHARTGHGAGHYFRALAGQDMSGIDIVLHQVMPFMGDYDTAAYLSGGKTHATFFHYSLGQLASSLADMTPRMRGRAMCEVFGAYGWGEGTIMEKWLIDFLLVRGVNEFVPHAFSPSYPDLDCPPHFGAEGHDPQIKGFSALMKYTNKMAHLLSGGRHEAPVAILYHAEAEWMGRRGEAMYMEVPAKELLDDHISYDYIWADMLCDTAKVSSGKLIANGMTFGAIVVPESKHLPSYVIERLAEIAESNVPVYYVNALPEGASGTVLKTGEIAKTIRKLGIVSIDVEGDYRQLRIYKTVRGNETVFMLFNESKTDCNTEISLNVKGKFARLALLDGKVQKEETKDGKVKVNLIGGQSELLYFTDGDEVLELVKEPKALPELREVSPTFKIEIADSTDLSSFRDYTITSELFDINGKGRIPGFSGFMRYTFTIDTNETGDFTMLDLGQVGQTAEIIVNGTPAGIRIAPPYVIDIGGLVKPGKNEIVVTIANTLANKQRDPFSIYLALEPSGLLGPVKIG